MVFKQNKSIGHQLLHEIRLRNRIERRERSLEIEEEETEEIPRPLVSNDGFQGLGYRKIIDGSSSTDAESLFLTFMHKFNNAADEFDEVKRKSDNRITFNGGDNEEHEEFNYELPDQEEE